MSFDLTLDAPIARIWTMWLQGLDVAPPLVRQCIESWQRFNPSSTLVVLDRQNLADYVSLPASLDFTREDLPVQKISAIARLAILEKYGGVWTDATVHCVRPLEDWLPLHLTSGFFAFANPGPDRMMSNWFMAAQPGNILVSTLYSELVRFFSENRFTNLNTDLGRTIVSALLPILGKDHESTLQWHDDIMVKDLKVYPYFIFHYTFNKIVLENKNCRKIWKSTLEFSADIPHALRKLGKIQDENKVALAIEIIRSRCSPVYKLDWRISETDPHWQAILKELACIRAANETQSAPQVLC